MFVVLLENGAIRKYDHLTTAEISDFIGFGATVLQITASTVAPKLDVFEMNQDGERLDIPSA